MEQNKNFAITLEWAESMATRLPPELLVKLKASLQTARDLHRSRQQSKDIEPYSSTFGGDAQRTGFTPSQSTSVAPGSWPKWTRQVERITGATDHNPSPSHPSPRMRLAYYPITPLIHKDRVYVNELTRVTAYELKDGKSWPRSESSLPLFDSGLTAASYLPFGYQIMVHRAAL